MPSPADPTKPCTLLYIDRASNGKTHITHVIGVCENGITLTIIPILTLLADQMSKFSNANQSYETIKAHHIDEIYKESRLKYNQVRQRIHGLKKKDNFCSLSVFFSSVPSYPSQIPQVSHSGRQQTSTLSRWAR